MWQGLQAIADFRPSHASTLSTDHSFPDELNKFYARFDCNNNEVATKATLPANHLPLTLSPTEVKAALSRTNKRKAAGLDCIPGSVLNTCAEQLPKQKSLRASNPPQLCLSLNTAPQRA